MGNIKLTVKTAKETNEKFIICFNIICTRFFFISREQFRKMVEQIATEEKQDRNRNIGILTRGGRKSNNRYSISNICKNDDFEYIDNVGTAEEIVTLYKNSVNKYGGFYIARYEAGSESKKNRKQWNSRYSF